MELQLKSVAEYLQGLRRKAALTCRLPPNRTHLGHGILQALKESPNSVQIDASDGRSECYSSVLNRALQLARTLFFYGYQPGDPAVILTTNDLDACLPFYACLFNGHPLATINYDCDIHNINYYLSLIRPKMIFCQEEKQELFKTALIECDLSIKIIIIGHSEKSQLNTDLAEYFPLEFDLSIPAFLVMTNGTTAQPRLACISHEMVWNALPYNYFYLKKLPKCNHALLLTSSMQALVGIQSVLMSALFGCNRIQSSKAIIHEYYSRLQPLQPIMNENCSTTQNSIHVIKEHCIEILEKYKPTYLICRTNVFLSLLNTTLNLDFLEYIHITGEQLPADIMKKFSINFPRAVLMQTYSLTETFSAVLYPKHPQSVIMKPFVNRFEYRLIDSNGCAIKEFDKVGELLIKDNYPFSGYYHQSKETNKVLNAEGYFKTGDLFSKDRDGNYHFISRIKKDEF